MRLSLPALCIALAASFPVSAGVQAAEFSCPAKLDTQQSVVPLPAGLPQGTRAGDAPLGNGAANLRSVTIYAGPPENGASLVPDSYGKNLARWNFAPDDPEPVWIGCGYDNTRMMIFIPVPGRPRQCRVTYHDPKFQSVRSIHCE